MDMHVGMKGMVCDLSLRLAQLELQKASIENPSLTDGRLHVSHTNAAGIILYQQSHAAPVGRLHIPSQARRARD